MSRPAAGVRDVVHPPRSPLSLQQLQLLPSPVFSLLTQLLPLPDKLLHLTHVCRSFPPLTPRSFACDTVAWTSTLIDQLKRSPSSPLLTLLSLVPRVLYVEDTDPARFAIGAVPELPQSPCPPLPFPALRALTIQPMWWMSELDLFPFPFPVNGVQRCPQLAAVHLCLHDFPFDSLSLHLSQLALIPSLRTLHLTAQLEAHELLRVLSLPVKSIDLLASTVNFQTPPPSPFPLLPPLHTFVFPHWLTDERKSLPRLSTLWRRALLSSLANPQGRAVATLERLLLLDLDPCELVHIPQLRRLRALQLRLEYQEGEEEGHVAAFYSALIDHPLPLRHLSVHHDVWDDRRGSWSPRLFSILPTFVSAYAAQLLSLELCHRCGEDYLVDPPSVKAAEAMTAALLSCHSLRRLGVSNWWLSTSLPAPPSPALPHLESLQLDVLEALDEATLAVLLDACPQVQELIFNTHSLPYDVLLWVGARCHELRTIVMRWEAGSIINYPCPLTSERWNAIPPTPTLPQLTTLILRCPELPSITDIRVSSFKLIVSHLIHCAPSLRNLDLPHLDWLEQHRPLLSVLGQLTQLRRLSLWKAEWMQQGALERYWMKDERQQTRSGQSRVTRDAGTDLWGGDALPRLRWMWRNEMIEEMEAMRMAGGWRSEEEVRAEWGWNLTAFEEEVDGMTGARALFSALSTHPTAAPASSDEPPPESRAIKA